MKRLVAISVLLMVTASPATLFASSDYSVLVSVYNQRSDLQSAFDPVTHRAVPKTAAGFLLDLEDWARQYGWKEHEELKIFGPGLHDSIVERVDLREIEDQIEAEAYIVMDKSTGKILTVKRENLQWPIASLTKLITADVVLDEDVMLNSSHEVRNYDNVGGARLWVNDKDTFSINDLFYATLVASANNAANALSRATQLPREDFLSEMNQRAHNLNLVKTKFVDPTGIELGNVSTPREFARLVRRVFERREIQRYTTTAKREIYVQNRGTSKLMKNTNWMLYKPQYDDLYVTGSKTGFLYESGWNLVTTIRPSETDKDRELLIVLFGAKSRSGSFKDTKKLANWSWDVHEWVKKK